MSKAPSKGVEIARPAYKAIREFEIAWDKGDFRYGSTIPREWLEHALGVSTDDTMTPTELAFFRGQWMQAVGQFRQHLLNEMKIMIVPQENPAGYHIVPPEQQTALAIEGFVRAVGRASRRATEIAENTNVDVLTAEQKREASDNAALLRRMQQSTRKVLLE